MQPDSQDDILTSADLEVYQETKYQDSAERLMARTMLMIAHKNPACGYVAVMIDGPVARPPPNRGQFETLQHSCRVRIDRRTETFATEAFTMYTRLQTMDRNATRQ